VVSVVVLAALLCASPLHATDVHDSEIDDVVASMNSEVGAIADLSTPDLDNVDASSFPTDSEHVELPSDADIEALSQDLDSLYVEARSIYNVEVTDKKLFKKIKAAVKKVATKVKHVAKKVGAAVKKIKPFVAAAALLVPGVGVAVGAVKAKAAAVAAKIKGSKFATKVIKTVKTIKSKVDKVKKVVKKVQNVRKTIARARDCLRQNGCVKAAVKSAAKSFVRGKVAAISPKVASVKKVVKKVQNVRKTIAQARDCLRQPGGCVKKAVKSAAKSFVRSKVAAIGGAVVSAIKSSNVGKAVAGRVDSVRSSVLSSKAAVVSRINDSASKLRSAVPQKLQGAFDRADRSVRAGAASAASKLRDRAVSKIGDIKPVATATKALKSIRDKVSTFSSATEPSKHMVVTSGAHPAAQPVISSSSNSNRERPNVQRPRSSSAAVDSVFSTHSAATVPTVPNLSSSSSSSSRTDRPNLSRPRSSTRSVPRRASLRATPRSRPVRVRVTKPKSGIFLKIVINALERAGYDADDLEDFENENVFDGLD